MIKKEVKKEVYLTKKERLMFQGGNFFVLRKGNFLYLLSQEEMERIGLRINNNYFGKEKRKIYRIIFSKIQKSSAKKRKIRIQSYLL